MLAYSLSLLLLAVHPVVLQLSQQRKWLPATWQAAASAAEPAEQLPAAAAAAAKHRRQTRTPLQALPRSAALLRACNALEHLTQMLYTDVQ